MKKVPKILNNLLIFCSIITAYYIMHSDYSLSGDKMEKRLDLISSHNLDLDGVDKIIIKTKNTRLLQYQHTIIEEKEKINQIVSGLKNTMECDPIFMADDYDISFWRDNKALLVLGLKIRFKYPDASFFRYRSDSVYDYRFSSEYYKFLVNLLSLDKNE